MKNLPRVAILADDLTGACDTGAAFAARGLETIVMLSPADLPTPPATVTVTSTESRGLTAHAASARVAAAAAPLATLPCAVVYKKIDSTLRGPIAAEVAACLEATGLQRALVTPAFPHQRRTVRDGILWLGESPADQTSLVRDPDYPRTGASVLALFAAGPRGPVTLLPLVTVRHGAPAMRARLGRPACIVVADAQTDDDLRGLAAATTGDRILLVGSAGLARAVAERLHHAPPVAFAPRAPVLVVAGSTHPRTLLQVQRLAARGVTIRTVTAEPSGPRTAVDTPLVLVPPPLSGLEPRAARLVVADRLADAAHAWLDDRGRLAPSPSSRGTVVVTGGDVASALCRRLGAGALVLTGEVEPGLPHGVLKAGPYDGLRIVTKAGAFGDPEALARILEEAR